MDKINGREHSTVTVGTQKGLYGEYKSKFLREAKNLAKLDNPHIVRVLETFEANNTVYYVMEYLDGGSLDEHISNKGRLCTDETVPIVIKIGNALSYMHQHLMLHLDLKPSNVMRRSDGNPVLIDFGLSKQYDEEGMPESSTKVGAGTPGYAPIEQANYREGRDFPVTMDIYALGGTMYKMLTGTRPPEASEILNEGFPADDLFQYNINQQVVDIIKKAMSPLKRNRYQSVEEMLDALKTVPVAKVEENETLEIADSSVIPNNSKAGLIRLNDATTTIDFTYLNYDITITPQKISVTIKNQMDETSSHSFFFSTSRFFALLNQINGLHLQQLPMRNMAHEVECSLSAFDSNGQYVDASSGNGGKFCLVGEKAKLIGLMEKHVNFNRIIAQQPHSEGKESSSLSSDEGKMLKWACVSLALIAVIAIVIGIAMSGRPTSPKGCPDENHPHFVDLGLPSGTKWACTNISGDSLDIEGVLFGNEYCLPTIQEFEELEENCSIVEEKDEFRLGTLYIGSNGECVRFENAQLTLGMSRAGLSRAIHAISGDTLKIIPEPDGNTGAKLIHYRYYATNGKDSTSIYYWGAEVIAKTPYHYNTVEKFCIRPVAH